MVARSDFASATIRCTLQPMAKLDIKKIIRSYSFEKRSRSGKTKHAKKYIGRKFKKDRILLIGFGGTISSGYTPTNEMIVPLFPSPAIKQIDYINLFGISKLKYDNIDLLTKDSRMIVNADIETLLDIIHLAPHKKILITSGTYMLPKVALAILGTCRETNKNIALTGSILPAGFVASEADANIWSALSILNYSATVEKGKQLRVLLVFHGRVFETKAQLEKLDLHPEVMSKLVIQYPLTIVPTGNIL